MMLKLQFLGILRALPITVQAGPRLGVGWRLGGRLRSPQRTCPRCGAIIHEVWPRPAGRPRRWCSPQRRRAASEEGRASASGAIGIEYVRVEADLDDCVRAVLESPGACRRIIRDIREGATNGRLSDARWSSVEAELQRVRPAQRARLRWGAQ